MFLRSILIIFLHLYLGLPRCLCQSCFTANISISCFITFSFLAFSSRLKMKACSSETAVDFQRTTRRYIPEGRILHNYRCENIRSYKILYAFLFSPVRTTCPGCINAFDLIILIPFGEGYNLRGVTMQLYLVSCSPC
jgi:hypothetical protein